MEAVRSTSCQRTRGNVFVDREKKDFSYKLYADFVSRKEEMEKAKTH